TELEPFGVADQNEVGADALQEVERLFVLGPDDLEPVLGEMPREKAPGCLLRLGEKESARHVIDASAGPSRAPDVLSREFVPKNRQPALTAVPALPEPVAGPIHRDEEVQVLALPRRNDPDDPALRVHGRPARDAGIRSGIG